MTRESANDIANKNILGEEKIGKLLLKFSIPAIIGMLVNVLYNVVDRIYIGQIPEVGGLAITGVGITMPITTIITGIGMLIGAGTSAGISLALGSGQKDKAQKVLGTGTIAIIIASLIVMVVGTTFALPIIELFGGSNLTTPFALAYIKPLFFGVMFNLIAFSLNNSISADGSPRVGMCTMIIGATINIILDPIMIFGLGMGIKGAAYATVISQACGACWVIFYFTKSSKSKLKLNKQTFRFDFKILKYILAIGMAPFCMQIAGSLVQVVSNKALLEHGGDLAIGAMAVIVSICTIFIMPIFGLNHGAQPIMGFNYGAGKFDRVKKTYYLSLIISTVILSVSYILIFLFPNLCISVFNNDPLLTEIALDGIRVYLVSMPIIGIQMTASNYFQSIGKPKKAMLIGLTRQVFFLIPAFMILPSIFGLEGVWLAGPVADVIAVVISSVVMARELRSLKTD